MADITLRILGQEPLPLNLGSDNSETLSVGSGVTEGRLQEVLTDYVPKSDIDTTLSISGDVAESKTVGDLLMALFPTDSASGSIASFSDGADNVPVKSLSVTIEPKQSGSGTPSPDNVRPISGWNETNVVRTGKNLLDKSLLENGSVNGNDGTLVSTQSRVRTPLIKVYPQTYTISSTNTNFRIVVDVYDMNGTFIKDESETAWSASNVKTMTFQGERKIRIVFSLSSNANISPSDVTNPQLELGSTKTDYAPYTGETYTIPYSSTIYGGTLDVTNGTLVVDRVYWKKNTSTMNNSENYPGWTSAGIRDYFSTSGNQNNAMTSVGNVYAVNVAGNNDTLYLPKNSYGGLTQTDWIALAVDVEIIIPLTTPQTITLTPTQVKTLLGYNNIYADSGSVNVVYHADIGKYIDKRIGA